MGFVKNTECNTSQYETKIVRVKVVLPLPTFFSGQSWYLKPQAGVEGGGAFEPPGHITCGMEE